MVHTAGINKTFPYHNRQYDANCSIFAPQHYLTKNPYHCYEAQYTASFMQCCRLDNTCSFSENKLESVVYHHGQYTRTAANPTLSLPHNTYRFSDLSSFLLSSCMSLLGPSRVGWGLVLTIIASTMHRHFVFTSAMASFNRHMAVQINSQRKIFALHYYMLYYIPRRVQ